MRKLESRIDNLEQRINIKAEDKILIIVDYEGQNITPEEEEAAIGRYFEAHPEERDWAGWLILHVKRDESGEVKVEGSKPRTQARAGPAMD